jgi:hypothetical protein
VKRGVEAGDLGKLWRILCDGPDGQQIVWLLQRRQIDQLFERGQNSRVDQHGPVNFMPP